MTSKAGAQVSRICKARFIPISSEDSELSEISFPSKQLSEDPFLSIGGYGVAITKPPYSMEQLVLLAEQHPVHAAALEQKAIDAVGRGPQLVPIGDDANDEQRTEIEEWLDSLAEQQTLVELVHQMQLDYETVGWGLLEVVRDNRGVVRRIHHVPAHTVRAHRDNRRYVQIRQGRQAWFKRWGVGLEDINILLANGRKAPEGTAFERIANELLIFVKPSRRSTWYGIPTYIAGVGYITMALSARDYNIKFFSNAREPRYILIVSGMDAEGVEDTLDDLERSLSTQHKDPHRNLILPLTGGTTAKVERITAVQNDMHFMRLMEAADRNILASHRMPPDRLGTVMRGMLGGNVAANINRIYKDAVVMPAQAVLDDRLNRFLKAEFGRSKDGKPREAELQWKLEFESLDISDETMDVSNMLGQIKGNLITLNEGREKLGYPARDDMNVTLVMSDSFRRDHIGELGNKGAKTPALDRFAAQV
ncbi:hypothetical protein LCGC14_1946230, partial [marine sediment metagenome]